MAAKFFTESIFKSTSKAGMVACVLTCALCIFQFRQFEPRVIKPNWYTWKSVGLFLKQIAAPGDLLAVDAAGAMPYYSELPTIDILGKADRQIGRAEIPTLGQGAAAHEKHDNQYVLRRKPVWVSTWAGPRGEAGRGFSSHFDFRRNYFLWALVDMAKTEISGDRIVPMHGDRTPEGEIALKAFDMNWKDHKGPFDWGIYHRREHPLVDIALTTADIKSNTGIFGSLTEDFLVRTGSGPDRAGHLVFGPFFRFMQGDYRVKMRVSFGDEDPTMINRGVDREKLCAFDLIVDREVMKEQDVRTSALDKKRTVEISQDFSIPEDQSDFNETEFRLFCFGMRPTTVHSIIVSKR